MHHTIFNGNDIYLLSMCALSRARPCTRPKYLSTAYPRLSTLHILPASTHTRPAPPWQAWFPPARQVHVERIVETRNKTGLTNSAKRIKRNEKRGSVRSNSADIVGTCVTKWNFKTARTYVPLVFANFLIPPWSRPLFRFYVYPRCFPAISIFINPPAQFVRFFASLSSFTYT